MAENQSRRRWAVIVVYVLDSDLGTDRGDRAAESSTHTIRKLIGKSDKRTKFPPHCDQPAGGTGFRPVETVL
jgi:hypothetical protein